MERMVIAMWMELFLILMLWITPSTASALMRSPAPDLRDPLNVKLPGPDPGVVCLAGTTGSVYVNRDRINLGDVVDLTWSAVKPAGCDWARISFRLEREAGLESVTPSGARQHQPIANETILLHASYADYDLILGSVYIGVTLPKSLYIYGNHLGRQVHQALTSTDRADRIITLADGVEIDLTKYGEIMVAPGVTLQSTRGGLRKGGRIYTTARREYGMLRIRGDNVRIIGLRISGPDLGPIDGDEVSRGILIEAANNVEIANNDIYGWTSAAIEVQDNLETNRIPFTSPYTIRIHDNFIHHNQHVGGNGYGVSTRYGGYALIQRNVFDWNRHAIAADARSTSGYDARENLVLENGGLHWQDPIFGTWRHTHMFDAHGSDSCLGIDHNCGSAGHSFYITYNTFLYQEDNAIRLRGTPQLQPYGMFVSYNAFAHSKMWDDAVSQTESGLWIGPGNKLNNTVQSVRGVCDFDADGVADDFMTTGVTWWYRSGGTAAWSYLNTSTTRLQKLSLGYFDGDSRCDVSTGSVIYSGGKPSQPSSGAVDSGVVGGGSLTLN